MVDVATRARTGERGAIGAGPQVTWESRGAEERQPQVKMADTLTWLYMRRST